MLNISLIFIASALLMLVNGWTDAPVTVATAVSSKAVSFNRAVLLSAISNLLGGITMCFFGRSVAVSVYEISGLSGQSAEALPCLIAAVLTVVAWSLLALKFGLPTSESHALLSSLSGSGVAAIGFAAINTAEWLKVVIGLAVTTYPLVILSYFTATAVKNKLKLGNNRFKRLQIIGALLSSFSHGAQDSQKFAAVLAVALSLTRPNTVDGGTVFVPNWTVLFSVGMITAGTFLGGRKIVNSIKEFAPNDPQAGFFADFTSAITLSVLSVFGVPAATTVAKTMAILGAGMVSTPKLQEKKSLIKMLVVWGLTFPACFIISFLLSKALIFISIKI